MMYILSDYFDWKVDTYNPGMNLICLCGHPLMYRQISITLDRQHLYPKDKFKESQYPLL